MLACEVLLGGSCPVAASPLSAGLGGVERWGGQAIQCTPSGLVLGVCQCLGARLPQRGIETGSDMLRERFCRCWSGAPMQSLSPIPESPVCPYGPYGALNRLMTWLHVMHHDSTSLAGSRCTRTVGGADDGENAPHQSFAAAVGARPQPITSRAASSAGARLGAGPRHLHSRSSRKAKKGKGKFNLPTLLRIALDPAIHDASRCADSPRWPAGPVHV